MNAITKHYRTMEIGQIQDNQHGFKVQLKLVGIGGETKWLSITDKEFQKIKKVLTGERICAKS